MFSFNNLFAHIGNNSAKNIPSVLFPITTVEIENEIIGLNANTSTRLYSTLVAILREHQRCITFTSRNYIKCLLFYWNRSRFI